MSRIKSIGFTALVSCVFFGILYFVPIEKRESANIDQDKKEILADEEILDNSMQSKIEESEEIQASVPKVVEPVKNEQVAIQEEQPKKEEVKEPKETQAAENKAVPVETKPQKKQEITKKTETPAEKKEDISKKTVPKESKIGVDRKLIAGIPGTMNYKGKLPTNNVREKGTIEIAYTVDKNGNVISAMRVGGLRSRNTINNAVTLVKKYVKAEKAQTNSTGVYTINFK
ncbi:MAG: hypothetical protein ACFNQA_06845 [Flavobacteriaceae bacterium]